MRGIIIFSLSLALAFSTWLQASPLWAAEPKPAPHFSRVGVALIDFDAAGLASARKSGLKALIGQELRKSGRFKVVRPEEKEKRLPKKEDKEGQRSLAETREIYKDGRDKFFDSRFEAAYEQLSKARRGYIRGLYLLENSRELLRVHLLLGRTLTALGRADEAREMFQRAIFIDPKLNLSSKNNPPSVLKLIAELKQEQATLDQVQVEIESQPSGARAYANGKKIGITPVSIKLPAGEYFVRLSRDGHRDWYSSIAIAPGNSQLERVLVPIEAGEPTASQQFKSPGQVPSLTQERVDFLSESAFTLGADYVFLGSASNAVLQAQLFDIRTQELSPVVDAALGASAAEERYAVEVLSRKLSALVNDEGYLAQTTKTPQRRTGKPALKTDLPKNMQQQWQKRSQTFDFAAKKKSQPWYAKWWVWTIAAAVVGGGTYLLVTQVDTGGNKIIIKNP